MGKITKDSLGDRQKQYEISSETFLVPKMPIVIRIDGKAFHTYTKGMVKPFDELLGTAMKRTMQALCKDIHTCVFGYTQSDEITLILRLPDRIKSQAYMNRRVQKITSLSASKATKYFNKFFIEEFRKLEDEQRKNTVEIVKIIGKYGADSDEAIKARAKANLVDDKLMSNYSRKLGEAEFDSRAFNVPEWDCINNIIWRQQDAIRNSVEMVGHVHFSANQLHKVNVEGIKSMLLEQKGIDWEKDFTIYQRRGACCYRTFVKKVGKDGKEILRSLWYIDENMPVIQNNRYWFAINTGLSEE